MENSKIPVVSTIYCEEWLLSYYYGSVITGIKKASAQYGSLFLYVEKW
ncbi:hypothetical protein ABIE50_005858 [Chitinophaga sp. OAE865]